MRPHRPIIPDDTPEDMALRERVDTESVGVLTAFVDNKEAKSQNAAAVAEVVAEEKDEKKKVAQIVIRLSQREKR